MRMAFFIGKYYNLKIKRVKMYPPARPRRTVVAENWLRLTLKRRLRLFLSFFPCPCSNSIYLLHSTGTSYQMPGLNTFAWNISSVSLKPSLRVVGLMIIV